MLDDIRDDERAVRSSRHTRLRSRRGEQEMQPVRSRTVARVIVSHGVSWLIRRGGGRAVATWNIAGGQVVLAPFAPLDTQTQAALAADAAAVMRFLGQ